MGTARRPDGSNTINRPKKDFCPPAAIGPVLRQFQRKTYEVRDSRGRRCWVRLDIEPTDKRRAVFDAVSMIAKFRAVLAAWRGSKSHPGPWTRGFERVDRDPVSANCETYYNYNGHR